MTSIHLTNQESLAIATVLNGDASDPVALVKAAGLNVATFFEFGDWTNVDFRRSNLENVSFYGSTLNGASFLESQISQVASTNPIVREEVSVRIDKDVLLVRLIGPLRVNSDNYQDLRPHNAKAQAILALLATAPYFRRSKVFLRDTLWSDHEPKYATASLRATVNLIRQALKDLAPVLESDQSDLWLNTSRTLVDLYGTLSLDLKEPRHSRQFLEGMTVDDPVFTAWLENVRQYIGSPQASEIHGSVDLPQPGEDPFPT